MGRLILHIFLLFSAFTACAQDTSFIKPSKFVRGDFSNLFLDNVGNLYILNNTGQLKKLDPDGDSIAVYNDVKRFGKISTVDATNPFRVLVYFAESSTIVTLDRFLTVRNVIDLGKINIPQVKAVCVSYDNNTWLYDEMNGKIRKIDDNGKLVFESADLRNAMGVAPVFGNIIDDNKSLYLYDINLGWYVFDYYGALSKKYPFVHWRDVQVVNGNMIGRLDSIFVTAKNGDFDYKKLKRSFPIPGAIKTLYQNKHWFALFPGRIEIYNAP